MNKSMDGANLRKKIIDLLKKEGATSSDEELNRVVMNMLKILPPARSTKSARTSKMLDAIRGPFPFPPPRNPAFTFIDLFAVINDQQFLKFPLSDHGQLLKLPISNR